MDFLEGLSKKELKTQLLQSLLRNDCEHVEKIIKKDESILNEEICNINRYNSYSCPIIIACQYSGLKMMKLLIRLGAKVDVCDSIKGCSLFSYAIEKQKGCEIMELLLEQGLNVNSQYNVDNWTPLMKAASMSKKELCVYLIGKGADLELKDIRENTAVMIACGFDSIEIAKMLMECGSYMWSEDIDGSNVLDYLLSNNRVLDMMTKSFIEELYREKTRLLRGLDDDHH